MPDLLPTPFLFRWSFPVRRVTGIPRAKSQGLNLPAECALPLPTQLDGAQARYELRAAWSDEGLGFSLHIQGHTQPPRSTIGYPLASDGLQVWLDTRNTQSVHRATRFCHHVCLLPTGGGADGKQPYGVQVAIPRAREESPLCNPAQLLVTAEVKATGYKMEAWIPAEALNGFDPEASPRLGWFYRIRDAELGDQFLSVGAEFPFATDPSVWSTLELVA